MGFRTFSTTAILAIGLAVVGAVSGPSWDPEVVADQLHPATSDTTIDPGVPTPAIGTYSVRSSMVTVELDGTSVPALIREPVGASGPTPGVVFIHGAGTGQPETAFTTAATSLASAGIATIVPAKRLDTYSVQHRDYEDMALDYAQSLTVLRERPGVDPDRVGLYAESEGTWIAPVMTARDPTIAFVAMISAPVVPPRSQAAFAVDSYLRNTGVPRGVFRAIPRAVGMELPGGGFEYADFDVRPFLTKLRQPVLIVYGTDDASMPTVQGAREILESAHAAGNDDVLIRYYAGANHGIRIDDLVLPDFLRDLTHWIDDPVESAHSSAQIAGANPFQEFIASEVPQSHWFGSGNLIVRLVIIAAGLMIIGPLLRLVRAAVAWARRRPRPSEGVDQPLGMHLVGLAGASVLTAAGLVIYLVMIARLALEYEQDPWLVQGGWLGIRAMGLIAAFFGALVINDLTDRRAARKQGTGADEDRAVGLGNGRVGAQATPPVARGVVGHITLWTVPTGCVLLLVILAYWGVFQLGI